MRAFASIVLLAPLLSVASVACIVEEHDRRYDPPPSATTSPPATPPPSSTAPAPTNPPPRISLDADRTLTAAPGDGAGIFITYASGGHWSLRWTCDTHLTAQSCAFDVSVATHGISKIGVASLPRDAVLTHDSLTLRAQTTTAATLDGVDVDVAPGSSIVVSATINGSAKPDLVFFVANGQLAKAPADPIELVPSAP